MLDRRRIIALLLPAVIVAGLAAAPSQPAAAAAPGLTCVEYLVGALLCSTPDAGPTGLRYTTYDATGQATTPGSYAFLDADGAVVTTYEGLRDGTTTGLRIHQSDGYGASQADTYSSVAVGNIFEWREAGDCWVRYEVGEVKTDPAGTAPRKEFAVEWRAYAFTGCTGTITTDTAVMVTADPASFFAPTIRSPVRYGPFQFIPLSWDGALEAVTEVARMSSGASGVSGDSAEPEWPSSDPATVRQHPLWNEPTLPAGWTISSMSAEEWYVGVRYLDGDGYWAAITWIARRDWQPRSLHGGYTRAREVLRTIDGHPAYVYDDRVTAAVYIINEIVSVEYFAVVFASDSDPEGRGIDHAIALARSLYQ